jgi:Putative MetA-pathway of phenol degradation
MRRPRDSDLQWRPTGSGSPLPRAAFPRDLHETLFGLRGQRFDVFTFNDRFGREGGEDQAKGPDQIHRQSNRPYRERRFIGAYAAAALIIAGLLIWTECAHAQQSEATSSSEIRQSLDDAWWTGPMLAPSAATLPRGHFLIEPYLFDVMSAHSNGFGSLTYMNYGLADKLTVGMIPTAGFNVVGHAPSSSGVGFGDITLQGQYRLKKFREGSWIPTTSITLQETFPTGKYDRLGTRSSDGFGSGAYTTTLALYTQTYFWLPNGRILRMRFNLSQGFSSQANVADTSVYGTTAGFRGHAKPGGSLFFDASWEYSITRKWVLALDATYHHTGDTVVSGRQNSADIILNSCSSEAFGFAPAIEYSWKSNLGVLLGTRIIPMGHNTPATITPAIAINFVH